MRIALTFLLIGSLCFSGNCQLDYRAEMFISSGFDEFALLPNGRIYVATREGMTYYADLPYDVWKIGPINTPPDSFDGENMDRVSFFNNSIGIISGYLHRGNNGKDYIYRTEDGGITWSKVIIDKGKWIDAEDLDSEGNAWLASSDQVIHYSSDFGATWRIIERPENTTNQRIVTLDFLSDKEGLAGTGWNRLYYTINNGISWEILPTPLDQEKYIANENHRPSIDKVMLTASQIFVNQAGRIFYAMKGDKLDWQEIPDAINFGYDSENRQVYVFFKGVEVCKSEVFRGGDQSIAQFKVNYSPQFEIRNGVIYSLAGSNLYLSGADLSETHPFYTDSYRIKEFEYFHDGDNPYWAHGLNSYYHRQRPNGKYYRVNKEPKNVTSIYPINKNEAIVSSSNFSYHELVNIESGEIKPVNLIDYLSLPTIDEILTISFSSNQYGCFHGNINEVTFRVRGDELEIEKIDDDKDDFKITGIRQNKYEIAMLRDLLSAIGDPEGAMAYLPPIYREKNLNEIKDHLKEVITSENEDYVTGFVESLVSPGIDPYFSGVFISSSTNWNEKRIIISYKNGDEVIITSTNSFESEMDLGWIVDYKGLKYKIEGLTLWRNFNKGINPSGYEENEKEVFESLFLHYCKENMK